MGAASIARKMRKQAEPEQPAELVIPENLMKHYVLVCGLRHQIVSADADFIRGLIERIAKAEVEL
jgi:hypothetical protein